MPTYISEKNTFIRWRHDLCRSVGGRFREGTKNEQAAYITSITINKTIYVPLFQVDEDKSALARW